MHGAKYFGLPQKPEISIKYKIEKMLKKINLSKVSIDLCLKNFLIQDTKSIKMKKYKNIE